MQKKKKNLTRQNQKNSTNTKDIARYHEAVSFVESFSNTSLRNNFGPNKKDPSFYLERTKKFLDLIGNPERDFKFIHITGTAGKGTVSTTVHNILTAAENKAGKKAGLYTSPYVTTTIEKMKVGDKYISPGEFVEIVDGLKPLIVEAEKNTIYGAPSAFELCLAISLVYFKRQKCEWVVLEVGLGGRYDATNIIEQPAVTAITNIDYDHTEILGKTLSKIAYDKAGIIKKGSAFYTSEQRPSLLRMFKKICKEKGAIFHHISKQKTYQEYNAKLAGAITREIGISENNIQDGISATRLPCRFEIIQENPLIILDGAHNRAKIKTTIGNMKKLSERYNKVIVVTAIADTKKDNAAILKPLASIGDVFVVTSMQKNDRKSVHPNTLAPLINIYKRKNASIEIVLDAHEALKYARKIAKPSDCILVTGSFFLAGELRTEWYSEEWVFKNQRSF